MIRPLLLSVFVLFLLVSAPAIAVAWESYPPPLTLTERIAGSDTVVFAEFLSSVESTVKARRDGRYRILHLAKPTKAAEVGQIVVVVARGGNRKAGEQAILAHHKAPSGDWWTASPSISRACFDYALAAPHPNEKDSERVAYFLRHLIASDSQISGDAFVELERVPFPTLAASAKLIPREFVAARLRDEATSASQVGLYGHLLGLAGNESDQRLLRGIIEQAPRGKDSFVPGFDGIAGGYLLLAGSEGLDWFEEFWVKDSRNPQTPFWHNYSAMLAVRFMWRNGEGRISRPRLRESMRLFLDSPELADLAISYLARWEDWSVHDRLVAMLRNPKFDAPQTKRAIIRYMVHTMRVPPEVQAHDPQGFRRAERFIRELRDTKWVTRTGVVQGFGHTNIVKIYESRIDLEPRTDLESQEPLTPFRKLLWDFAAVFVLPKDPAADDTPADPPADPPDDPPDDPKAADQQTLILKRLKDVDALVFKSKGIVVEVIANRTKITDDDLDGLSEFPKLTDLSLEETAITDKGLAHLTKLDGLVWLNLYQTKITDDGLRHVAELKRLELLPIGETKVTDKGLAHLKKMTQLTYLGLRANPITDKGVAQLAGLTELTSLYLGETKVTDAGLMSLAKMTKLKKLWLNDTAVSDEAIPQLARLKSLRKLHVEDSQITAEGVAALRRKLPACEILDGR